MSHNNSLITAEEPTATAVGASGVFNLKDQYDATADGEWPLHIGTFDVIFRIKVSAVPFVLTIARAGAGPVTYDIDWGDGTTGNNAITHTYTQTGFFDIGITTTNAYPFQLQSNDSSNASVIAYAAKDTFSMTISQPNISNLEFLSALSFPNAAFATLTNLQQSFAVLRRLKEFPLLDLSSCTNFNSTWSFNQSLKSFPACDVSSGTNFSSAWRDCLSLISFPVIDVSQGTDFSLCWAYCRSLPTFPALDFSSATTFRACWYRCNQLSSFPANVFHDPATGNAKTHTLASNAFALAFQFCSLSAQSIENILMSLDAHGQSGIQLHIDHGNNAGYSTWSSAAQTALSNLQNKNWTVSYNS